jgi:hypothetical protein
MNPAKMDPGVWIEQRSFAGDCRKQKAGSVCITFTDGYVWLIHTCVLDREEREEEGKIIERVTSSKINYDHILGTEMIRVVKK